MLADVVEVRMKDEIEEEQKKNRKKSMNFMLKLETSSTIQTVTLIRGNNKRTE